MSPLRRAELGKSESSGFGPKGKDEDLYRISILAHDSGGPTHRRENRRLHTSKVQHTGDSELVGLSWVPGAITKTRATRAFTAKEARECHSKLRLGAACRRDQFVFEAMPRDPISERQQPTAWLESDWGACELYMFRSWELVRFPATQPLRPPGAGSVLTAPSLRSGSLRRVPCVTREAPSGTQAAPQRRTIGK